MCRAGNHTWAHSLRAEPQENHTTFDDRAEAGRLLARRLEKHRGQHPLVLAIPRGAVPMGKIVAEALDGELDVVPSAEASRLIRQEADEVVCLETPEILYAIGYHFRDFSQVSDEDVVATLRDARRSRVATGPSA